MDLNPDAPNATYRYGHKESRAQSEDLQDRRWRGHVFRDNAQRFEVFPTEVQIWREREPACAWFYPTTSLANAREKRLAAKQLIANGVDPSANRKAQKRAQQESTANSFEIVGLEWLEKFSSQWSTGHRTKQERRLEKYVFPFIGAKSVSSILAPEILQLLRKIEETGAIETAHRVQQICEQIFRYAVITGRAEQNPSSSLKGALTPPKVKHRSAVVDPNELSEVLVKLETFQGSPQVKAAITLLPHLFARPGELRHMKWSEINFDTAEWRHTLSKTKTEQTTPLSTQAIGILKSVNSITKKSIYVFPSARTVARPISENTINAALRTLGINSEKTTGHGFRATARTILDEVLKFRPEVIEQQLGHAVRDPNGRAYNRTTHLEERKLMMQRWSDFLGEISSRKILR